MAKNSSNIKPYYGRMAEGINIFNNVELTSEGIKKLLNDYSLMHIKVHLAKQLKNDNTNTKELEYIKEFLDKYNMKMNNDLVGFTLGHEDDEYVYWYVNEEDDKVPNTFLSVPQFILEDGILVLNSKNLIISNRLFDKGFKFTFDKDMETRIAQLPTVGFNCISVTKIVNDLYSMNGIADEENIQSLINFYNSLGYEKICKYIKDNSYKVTEKDRLNDIVNSSLSSFCLTLDTDSNEYDYYFTNSISLNYSDYYDTFYVKWLNCEDKYAFVNTETYIESDGEEMEYECYDLDIFNDTYDGTNILSYNEFIDKMKELNSITE